jgi:RNA polymerase sigma-70 factor (ECF subfamily)
MEAFAKFAQWKVGANAKALNLPMSEAEPSDYELLQKLAQGSDPAFGALYERYQGLIYRFALHMGGDSATAKETTQEVFMLLITQSRGYDPAKGSVGGYLFGIARNLTRRSLRHTRLEVPLEEEDVEGEEGLTANGVDALEGLTQAERLDCLRKAVLALPEAYRETVILCDLEEMSYADAGEALGCSPGTVASRLHRARALLKTKLKSQPCVK